MLSVNQLTGFGAGGGRSQIQFVGGKIEGFTASAYTTYSLTSGLTGGIASAVADGDLVIAAYAVGYDTTWTPIIQVNTEGGANYTTIGSILYANDTKDTNLLVAYRFVSGDTAAAFNRTGNLNASGARALYVFRGVDPSAPLDVAEVTATGINGQYANPPSITPATAGATIVCVGAAAHADGVDTFTSGDLTDFRTAGANGGNDDTTLGIGRIDNWSTGAFDAAAFGFTGSNSSNNSWAAMSIALRPA
jgi:hypothetical protein